MSAKNKKKYAIQLNVLKKRINKLINYKIYENLCLENIIDKSMETKISQDRTLEDHQKAIRLLIECGLKEERNLSRFRLLAGG